MQQDEVGVEHHVSRFLVLKHVDAVLRDARRHEVELAALCPELREVGDDSRMAEEALHLVDVEPGRHAPFEVPVHAVAHRLQDRDDAERPHVLGEVLEVDVRDALLEGHVGFVVEKREGAFDVALVSQGDLRGFPFGLRLKDSVEVLKERQPSLRRARRIGRLHAPADDRLVRLGKPLGALGHRRRREGQEGVDLERHLRRSRLVRHVGEVEGVEVRARAGREPDALAAAALDDRAVLAGGIQHDDLVVRVREYRVHDLALHGERLARSRFAGDEAHRAREQLAVAEHQVGALLVLPVVASARLHELLRGERHLHGDLRGRHHPRDLHVVVPQGQHGVHALSLAVVERVDLD